MDAKLKKSLMWHARFVARTILYGAAGVTLVVLMTYLRTLGLDIPLLYYPTFAVEALGLLWLATLYLNDNDCA